MIEEMQDGGFIFTGEHINTYRLITIKNAIKLWRDHKMMMTRGATISKMLAMASDATGNTYKKNVYWNIYAAILDLENIIESVKS